MFDELTKTFDDEEIKSVKSNSSRVSKKSTGSKKSILAVAEEDANVEELVSEDNREQKDENKLDEMAIEEGDDTNLNKSKTQTNANKKKKKGKQK